MNRRLGFAALATFLVIAGFWTLAYGGSLRADVECNDTEDCEPGPVTAAGWVMRVTGLLLLVGAITSVARARMEPPLQPRRP